MQIRRQLFGALVPLVLLAATPEVEGQLLPFPLGVEARFGAGLPTGDFAGGGAFRADPGPAFGIGVRLEPVPLLGLHVGYQATRFGCPQCSELGWDTAVLAQGLEVAAHLALPVGTPGFTPWLRGGVLHQTLGFSGHGDRMTSRSDAGFSIGAGVAVPAGVFELSPGVHFQSVPAAFEFSEHPPRSLDASRLALDVGLLVRF